MSKYDNFTVLGNPDQLGREYDRTPVTPILNRRYADASDESTEPHSPTKETRNNTTLLSPEQLLTPANSGRSKPTTPTPERQNNPTLLPPEIFINPGTPVIERRNNSSTPILDRRDNPTTPTPERQNDPSPPTPRKRNSPLTPTPEKRHTHTTGIPVTPTPSRRNDTEDPEKEKTKAIPPLDFERSVEDDWEKFKREAKAECLPGPIQPGYTSDPGAMWHTNQSTCVIINQPSSPRPLPVTYVHTDSPAQVMCHNCNTTVMTYCYYESGTFSYVACCALMLLGCDFGCCLLPFCVDRCKDVIHKCPRCHVILGRYKRM